MKTVARHLYQRPIRQPDPELQPPQPARPELTIAELSLVKWLLALTLAVALLLTRCGGGGIEDVMPAVVSGMR